MRNRWRPIERTLRAEKGPLIAGVDEVGRGPLAGPVVACAVVMPPDQRAIRGVDDSKKLSAEERERLAIRILETAIAVGVGAASVREIDRVNIYHANVIAMRRALRRLKITPDHVVLDGKSIRSLEWAHTAIVGGDAKCYSIACASIIAKVTRDRVMHALAKRYPGYRWEKNVGYSTAAHFQGIAAQGVTPHHRKSFIPIAQLALDFTGESVIDIAALQALAEQHSGSEILSDPSLLSGQAPPSFLVEPAGTAELPPLS
jgi:ribonuclease HII